MGKILGSAAVLSIALTGLFAPSASAAMPLCEGAGAPQVLYSIDGKLESVIVGNSGRLYFSSTPTGNTTSSQLLKIDRPGATPELVTMPGEDSSDFLSQVCPYSAEDLIPRLWNRYRRITLVSKTTPERVTLDIDLDFRWQERQVTLPGIVIAEVKQPGHGAPSAFVQRMREVG